jgi:uncharacterized protein YjdB
MSLFLAAFGSISCGGSDNDDGFVNVTAISLDKPAITLQPGQQQILKADVLPINATNKTVSWSVSNPYVAMVSSEGTVTALTSGEADIIVTTHNGKVAMCRLTVVISVTGVSLNRPALPLGVGGFDMLSVSIQPDNATNQRVTWFTSNAAVAGVSDNGIVTAYTPGTAWIWVVTEDGGYSVGCTVTVTMAEHVAVTGLTLNKTHLEITEYSSERLLSNVIPANATNTNVSWSSSHPGVAAVAIDGTVTGMSIGTATITATTQEGGFEATCEVTVTSAIVAVTGVAIEPASLLLTVGDEARVNALVLPANATNKIVTWRSNDPGVAAVIGGSVITGATVRAMSAGTAIITATTEDGGFEAECEVTVANVYAAGYEDNAQGIAVAKLWVNGVPRELGNGIYPSYANSVFVSNGIVYVAGYELKAQVSRAMLWVNDGMSVSPVDITNGSSHAGASSVAVSNGVTYVAGYEENMGVPVARLWMNGVPLTLSGSGTKAGASSVFIEDGIVYVAGYEEFNGISRAKLWVNFVPSDVSTGSVNAAATSVFVSGGKICVAGYENSSPFNTLRRAMLWINGAPEILSADNNNAAATSVCASGSNVYVAGYENNAYSKSIAAFWRSEAGRTSLSDGSYNAAAASIFVFAGNGNIYVAGHENNPYGRSAAMLWINGIRQPLTDGGANAMANAVFVK